MAAGLSQGLVKLVIVPPVNPGQLQEVQRCLRQVEKLRLVMVGGSAGGGAQIVVSAEEPIPLVSVLKEIPVIAEVVKGGEEIQIILSSGK